VTIFTRQDADYLLGRPEFRRFLFAAIQTAGILGHHAPANGQMGRDLGHFEGRRSLGFDLLRMVDDGQPEPLRSPEALATIDAAIREAVNPAPQSKEKPRGRRTDDASDDDTARYAELPDD
jgi:hypothetical protein